MDDKEKLIELLCKAINIVSPCICCDGEENCEEINHAIDYLIANGVAMQRWIPVEEQLPENEEDVLVLAQRKYLRNGRHIPVVTIGFHTDGKHHTEDSCYVWNDLTEWVEEFDAYMIPEGWWERVIYGEEFGVIDDFVTHWMPLPQPQKEG